MRIATDNDEVLYNQTWLAAQPKVVRALLLNPNPMVGAELTKQGYRVDGLVFFQGQSPYRRNKINLGFGYVWVPSYGQPTIESAPGEMNDGQLLYDPDNPPRGSILLTLDMDLLPTLFLAPVPAKP